MESSVHAGTTWFVTATFEADTEVLNGSIRPYRGSNLSYWTCI